MAYEPIPGDVIRYDFLWSEEKAEGRVDGLKDRPCAIVVARQTTEDGSYRVLLAPITHTPPYISDKNKGIEIPAKVSRHLGLDDKQSWIKTHEVNQLTWSKDQIPVGVVPTKQGSWTYGSLPDALNKQMVSEIRANARTRSVEKVDRDIAEEWKKKKETPEGQGDTLTRDKPTKPDR